jgi:hypothetical protein
MFGMLLFVFLYIFRNTGGRIGLRAWRRPTKAALQSIADPVLQDALLLKPTDDNAWGDADLLSKGLDLRERGPAAHKQTAQRDRGDQMVRGKAVCFLFLGVVHGVPLDEDVALPVEQYVARLVEKGKPELIV